MIAKQVALRSLKRSDFAALVTYLTDGQAKTARLGSVTVNHCEAATLKAAVAEVLATQRLNTRAQGDKTYHLLVSFRPGERPDDDTLQAIEARICEGLGFAEHQRISVVHHDTDNLHVHIAVNTIHPTRHTFHEPYQAYCTLAELCTVLERDYGLERDNHQPRRRSAEASAADLERHAGIESLVGWIQRACLDAIRSAPSWAALHPILRENGLELRPRANGLIFETVDGTRVKASTVARDLSKPKLEARLGPFAPSLEPRTEPRRQYQKPPLPLRVNTAALYARYQDERQNAATGRRGASREARTRKERRLEAAKRANRLRRALKIAREASPEDLAAALKLAMARHGERLTVNGTTEFKQAIIQAAAAAQLPLTFADPVLERQRQALLLKAPNPARPNPPAPHRGAPPLKPQRWGALEASLNPGARTAAEHYITEREQKRLQGLAVPRHAPYRAGQGALSYAGTRTVAGQPLALLKSADAVLVLPIDAATARRLKRLAIGAAVAVTPRGAIKIGTRTRR